MKEMKRWFRRRFNKPRRIVILWALYVLILNFFITYRLFKYNFIYGLCLSLLYIWFMSYMFIRRMLLSYYMKALPDLYKDIAIDCYRNKMDTESIRKIGEKSYHKRDAIRYITELILDDVKEYVIYACLSDGNKATSLEYNKSDMPYLTRDIAKFIYKLIVDNPSLILAFHTIAQNSVKSVVITPNTVENHYDSN